MSNIIIVGPVPASVVAVPTHVTNVKNAETASLLLGAVESSLFATLAETANTASFLLGSIESASFAETANTASLLSGGIQYTQVQGIPVGLVSSSVQIPSVKNAETASLLLGSVVSASFAETANTASLLSGGIQYTQVQGIPVGLVSSSVQIPSVKNAETASLLLGSVVSASFAETANTASLLSGGIQYTQVQGIPVGLVSSSVQIPSVKNAETASLLLGSVVSASFAENARTASFIEGIIEFPNNLIVTGSVTASAYTGSFVGDGSGLINVPGGGSADWDTLLNKPVGIVTSSVQLSGSSFQGLFTGSLAGSASFAETANTASLLSGGIQYTQIQGIPLGLVSSSVQIPSVKNAETASLLLGSVVSASFAETARTASFIEGAISFPDGLIVTGSVTASAYTGSFVGDGSGLINVPSADILFVSSSGLASDRLEASVIGTVETSFQKTFVIPANTLATGMALKIIPSFWVMGTGTSQVQIRFKLNGINIFQQNANRTMFSTSGIINALHAEGVVHVISSGVSGKVQMSTAGSSADLRYMERNILSNITIDTTIAQTLSVSVQYTSNPVGTWLELYGLIVEKLVMV